MWLQLSLETEQQKPPQAVWRGGYSPPAEMLPLTPEALTPPQDCTDAQVQTHRAQGLREPCVSACGCEQVPGQRVSRKRGFILAPSLRLWSSRQRYHGNGSMQWLSTLHPWSGSRKNCMLVPGSLSPLYSVGDPSPQDSGTRIYGGFSTSINSSILSFTDKLGPWWL